MEYYDDIMDLLVNINGTDIDIDIMNTYTIRRLNNNNEFGNYDDLDLDLDNDDLGNIDDFDFDNVFANTRRNEFNVDRDRDHDIIDRERDRERIDSFDNIMENILGRDFLNNLINEINEINMPEHAFEDVKITLSEDDFNKFKYTNISNRNISKYKNLQCNICMEEYKNKDTVLTLKCNHIYHKDCIKNWLCNEKTTCPMCRKDTRTTF